MRTPFVLSCTALARLGSICTFITVRLLNNRGAPTLTKNFDGKDIPCYAILSRTWGVDDKEVTFKDLENGLGKGKTSYDKILFCGEQARKDDLQ